MGHEETEWLTTQLPPESGTPWEIRENEEGDYICRGNLVLHVFEGEEYVPSLFQTEILIDTESQLIEVDITVIPTSPDIATTFSLVEDAFDRTWEKYETDQLHPSDIRAYVPSDEGKPNTPFTLVRSSEDDSDLKIEDNGLHFIIPDIPYTDDMPITDALLDVLGNNELYIAYLQAYAAWFVQQKILNTEAYIRSLPEDWMSTLLSEHGFQISHITKQTPDKPALIESVSPDEYAVHTHIKDPNSPSCQIALQVDIPIEISHEHKIILAGALKSILSDTQVRKILTENAPHDADDIIDCITTSLYVSKDNPILLMMITMDQELSLEPFIELLPKVIDMLPRFTAHVLTEVDHFRASQLPRIEQRLARLKLAPPGALGEWAQLQNTDTFSVTKSEWVLQGTSLYDGNLEPQEVVHASFRCDFWNEQIPLRMFFTDSRVFNYPVQIIATIPTGLREAIVSKLEAEGADAFNSHAATVVKKFTETHSQFTPDPTIFGVPVFVHQNSDDPFLMDPALSREALDELLHQGYTLSDIFSEFIRVFIEQYNWNMDLIQTVLRY